MLRKVVRKPGHAFILRQAQDKFLGLLIVVALLTTACSRLATTVAPEPASMPTDERSQADDAWYPQRVPNSDLGTNSGRRIKFERISVEHGLSQSSVLCILQDSKGFMWFGTEDGLNKYDGYGFTVYRHDPENPHSLSDNIVRAIHEDRSGGLWIGTHEGLDKFDRDTGRFTHYQHDPNNPNSLSSDIVLSIHQDREGVLWIGTDGGLNKLDRDTEQFTRYQNDPRDPNSLSDNFVRSIYQDRSGMLWIGTNGGGLDKLVLRKVEGLDRESEQFVHYRHDPSDPYSMSHHAVLSIYEDQSGVLWIGTADGLNKFDRHTEQFIRYQNDPGNPHSLSDNVVLSIHQDRSGVLWIGTNGGGLDQLVLSKVEGADRSTERFTHYQNDLSDPNSLSSNVVVSIYEDRSGALWIGTSAGGINKLDRSTARFVHYQNEPNNPDSLSDNMVRSIFQDRKGVLWIGTQGGLNKYDRVSRTFTSYGHDPEDPDSLSDNDVFALYEDRDGRLWVGTEEGLHTFYRDTETFRRWMSRPVVTSIFEDSGGMLWVGALDGLTRLGRARATVKNYQHDPKDAYSLSSNGVRAIYEDHLGVLWIGTDEGLNRFDRDMEQFTHYQKDPNDPNSLSDNFVLSIHQDPSGVLWVATYGGGLDRFDRENETFTHYTEKDGLPSDAIYGILEDNQSNLWLSTNKGLSKFDPRTETFKNYDMRDGLQSNEFNGGAYHKSSSGEMFFGGINGFNAFYPESIKDNPYIPLVALTSLTQSGEDVEVGQAVENVNEVTFHWPNNFFEFEFAALSYMQPEKNQYAYKLEGFREDWNNIGTRRFGKYTNLPGRTYTLRMKGSNNDGMWNEEGISVKITIVPPFWETWWFRGIVALVLVGSAIGGYRLRVQSIEVRSRELEIQVEERTHTLEQRTQEIEQRRQELEALYRADAELHRHLRLDEVLQALADIAVDILSADKSSLLVWDDRRERLVVRVARGFRPETLAHMSFTPGEGTVGHVATTGEPFIVEDAHTDPRIVKRSTIIDPEGIRSFMQVPIKVGGEVFGVFSADYAQPRAFGDDEQRLFIALAQRAALAIDTAQLYEQTRQLAVVEERNRLARELHDAVTQTLFSSSLIAEALPALWESDQDEGQQLLKELRQLTRGALAEMRTLLLELRPAALVETSLGNLLRQLGEAVTGRKGVPVTVTVGGECALPDDVHVALYRIAQEALNNVVKHADANQVTVNLHFTPPLEGRESIELCITDDGCGFDPSSIPPDRLGLGIIRERAQAIGATLEIESQPGLGTQIVVRWKNDE